MYIIKASGQKVKFNPNKVKKTCLRAGANRDLAEKIVQTVNQRVYNGMGTEELLELILSLLRKQDPLVAGRYNLKKAMLDLGPTGFIFEEFVLRLLKLYDFQAWFPPLLNGACVQHEVDIIAKSPPLTKKNKKCFDQDKDDYGSNKVFMIECKYHHSAGMRSGLKDTLYVWARFLDLRDAWKQGRGQKFDYPWLISNTKFSETAIQYAQCKKMRLLGWRFPQNSGLEKLIEKKSLYPITILSSLDFSTKEKLFSQKIILCQDLLSLGKEALKRKVMISENKAENLINEARIMVS